MKIVKITICTQVIVVKRLLRIIEWHVKVIQKYTRDPRQTFLSRLHLVFLILVFQVIHLLWSSFSACGSRSKIPSLPRYLTFKKQFLCRYSFKCLIDTHHIHITRYYKPYETILKTYFLTLIKYNFKGM